MTVEHELSSDLECRRTMENWLLASLRVCKYLATPEFLPLTDLPVLAIVLSAAVVAYFDRDSWYCQKKRIAVADDPTEGAELTLASVLRVGNSAACHRCCIALSIAHSACS